MNYTRRLIDAILKDEYCHLGSYRLSLKTLAMNAEYELIKAEQAIIELKNIDGEEVTLP